MHTRAKIVWVLRQTVFIFTRPCMGVFQKICLSRFPNGNESSDLHSDRFHRTRSDLTEFEPVWFLFLKAKADIKRIPRLQPRIHYTCWGCFLECFVCNKQRKRSVWQIVFRDVARQNKYFCFSFNLGAAARTLFVHTHTHTNTTDQVNANPNVSCKDTSAMVARSVCVGNSNQHSISVSSQRLCGFVY